ncbi:MAG: RnfABCDGE type electron transport complex subunit B [Caldicoprobacteraceae bacterium]|jgi:electron transport complex protein RnfB
MKVVLTSLLSLGGMGLLFGALLAFASKKFSVETDPRIEAIRDALPGANCGACGYPGCDGFAAAVAAGEAPVDGCTVGGAAVANNVGIIMGIEVDAKERQAARVLCQGDCENAKNKYEYRGVQDCVAASMLADGPKECRYGCLGLGTCVRACPFDAIYISEKGIAVVDSGKCTGCGICVQACPKNLIELIPESSLVQVLCISKDPGKQVRDYCKAGCIGCRLCVRACRFDAIEFADNLARIDYSKCVNCMMCAEKCPTGTIYADFAKRKTAVIDEEKCIGCTACKRVCKFDAIEGAVKEKHRVLQDKCTGCGLCVEKCPVDAISME